MSFIYETEPTIIGNKIEEYCIIKYNLRKIISQNDKWDACGYNNIKVQIKYHKKDTDINLGSYNYYSFMKEDFLLLIVDHQYDYKDPNFEKVDINNVTIQTYYISCHKWNNCFLNRDKNIEKIKTMNKKTGQEIDKNKLSFYETYGNNDYKYFTKIKFYPKNRKDGIEKSWTVLIKKEKINDFLKKFEKVNIVDYSYYWNIYKSYTFNDISIIKYKNSFNIKYQNKNFIIEPEILFNNCKYEINKNKHLIKFNIDLSNPKCINFKKFINKIYDKLNICIKKEESMKDEKHNFINFSNCIYAIINKNTKIINIENNKKLELNNYNGSFSGYPTFWPSTLNIYNDKIYVNFIIHKIYIKL